MLWTNTEDLSCLFLLLLLLLLLLNPQVDVTSWVNAGHSTGSLWDKSQPSFSAWKLCLQVFSHQLQAFAHPLKPVYSYCSTWSCASSSFLCTQPWSHRPSHPCKNSSGTFFFFKEGALWCLTVGKYFPGIPMILTIYLCVMSLLQRPVLQL